jgi:hypothetical protein
MQQSIFSGLAAFIAGVIAMVAATPVPDVGFVLQGVGVGALIGTAVALRVERRARRRGLRPNADLRWIIVARWTLTVAGLAIVADVVARVIGARL